MRHRHSTLSLRADVTELAAARRFIEAEAIGGGALPSAVYELVLAVDELVANVIIHGYQGRSGQVDLHVTVTDGRIEVQILDGAPLFDPTAVLPPDVTAPLDQRPLGGMGIHLARSYSDSLTYRVTPDGRNELILVRCLETPA